MDFDNYLPESKDLGLLRVDFLTIKNALKPNPKEMFSQIKGKVPPVLKDRILVVKEWLEERIQSITGVVITVDDHVT